MHIQNLDKFYKSSQDIKRNEIMADGRTDGRTDGMTDNPNPIKLTPLFQSRAIIILSKASQIILEEIKSLQIL